MAESRQGMEAQEACDNTGGSRFAQLDEIREEQRVEMEVVIEDWSDNGGEDRRAH